MDRLAEQQKNLITPISTRVLIIGSGPAGCTAALYAARAGLNPIMMQGRQPGGQLTITNDVENYPGFANSITGPDLMDQMTKQAQRFDTRIIPKDVVSVDFSTRPFGVEDDSGGKYLADTIVIATGASARWLGIESEKKFMGFGVSSCATCDGFFYKNQNVLVVGGGNTAAEEAIYLSSIAKKVTLIHRRDKLRAEDILQRRIFATPNIEILWNSNLVEILGQENGSDKNVIGVLILNHITFKTIQLDVQGVFIAIGHSPNTRLFNNALNCDEEGYIITAPGSTKTSIAGVFAAGDVQDKVFRQAVTAAGSGCMAALEAQKFLSTELDEINLQGSNKHSK
jgi:thioredoxin reductase (NADPH)